MTVKSKYNVKFPIRVGTLGGGQLAMMLAEAGKDIGVEIHALVDDLDCPAKDVAHLVKGDQNDASVVADFVKDLDVLTFEFENVNFESLKNLKLPIHPNIYALKIAQDRESEKKLFNKVDVPTTSYVIVQSPDELRQAFVQVGFPCVIKTCRDGYDGKGQKVLQTAGDADDVWQALGEKRLIVENLVKFDREVSLIAVRSLEGETLFYPLTENQHQGGILRLSKAPYTDPALQLKAEQYAQGLLEALNYVGVLAIEFFVEGLDLIANEIAPRVHNSGHWTIEGSTTSQFENHLRAICGLPLGEVEMRGSATMINIIGTMPDMKQYQDNFKATIHDYHKAERPNRKIAHVTIVE